MAPENKQEDKKKEIRRLQNYDGANGRKSYSIENTEAAEVETDGLSLENKIKRVIIYICDISKKMWDLGWLALVTCSHSSLVFLWFRKVRHQLVHTVGSRK